MRAARDTSAAQLVREVGRSPSQSSAQHEALDPKGGDGHCGGEEARQATPRERSQAVELFRALGHEVRLQVLLSLARNGKQTVSELLCAIGIEQSALSHQLRILRSARLVRSERDGRNMYYSLFDRHVSHVIGDAIEHVRESTD